MRFRGSSKIGLDIRRSRVAGGRGSGGRKQVPRRAETGPRSGRRFFIESPIRSGAARASRPGGWFRPGHRGRLDTIHLSPPRRTCKSFVFDNAEATVPQTNSKSKRKMQGVDSARVSIGLGATAEVKMRTLSEPERDAAHSRLLGWLRPASGELLRLGR